MSRFVTGMIDALNAEIALGTVANVNDAVQWLGYTYLFVRMRKNPFQYGTILDVQVSWSKCIDMSLMQGSDGMPSPRILTWVQSGTCSLPLLPRSSPSLA